MRQRMVPWAVWCVFSMIALLMSVQPAVARTLVVAINHAPPYRIVEMTPSGPVYSGIYVDVARIAAARAGIELEFEVVPFRRALYMLEHGDADLMLGPNRTDERQKYMYYFGAALPEEPKIIYTGVLDADVKKIEDLAGRSIGILRGANYGRHVGDISDVRKVEAADYLTLFRMLDEHRISAMIVPELLAIELLKQEGPMRIRRASLVLQGSPSFIAVSRQSPYFISGDFTEFERRLVEMRHDGTFAEIYARYVDGAM